MNQISLIKPKQQSIHTTQTPGMHRTSGIASDTCGSTGLWVGLVNAPPGKSAPHHHGEAESGIYLLSGTIRMHYGNKLEHNLLAEEGDFIYVPANVVHVEENISETENAKMLVSRNSANYMVFNVTEPR